MKVDGELAVLIGQQARRFYEERDNTRLERMRSRMCAFFKCYSGSEPCWNTRLRIGYHAVFLRWSWVVYEQQDRRVIAEGKAWTLGGVFKVANTISRPEAW